MPPFALTVYHTSFGRVLVLSIHHAIYDGISLPLILEGIERTYTGISLVSSPNTPEVSNYLTSLNQSDARSFWLDHFNNYEWPALVDVGNIQSSTSGSCKIPLRARPSELKNLISKQRVTLQSLFTAAFATLLSSALYSKSDVAFGVIRSGRLLPLDRVSDSLCPLITVLPLRLHVDAPNLLQTVQNWISGTVEHEHVPLGKVQNWVRPGKPLFDTLFSVSLKDDKPSEIWNVIESNPPRADYLLSTEIVVSTSQDTILIQCAWLADILDSATMVDLFEKFESILLMIASGNRSVPVRGLIRAETSGSSTEPAVSHADGHALSPSLDLRLVEKLRSIIAEFLGVDKIILGNSTSFISLGLDSIKSVGLARALQRQGFKASPNHILRFSTLELLATALTSANASLTQDDQIDPLYHDFLQRLQGSVNAQALALGTGDKIAIYPTTALQAGMLSRTIGSEGKLYVHAFPLFLSPIVDIARLRSSWFAVVERLSVLRTSFHFDNDLGIWFQAVHSLNTLDWTQVTSDSLKDSERKLTDFVQETVFRREADFRKPPLRVRLVQSVSPDAHRHCLVFILHHALYDGVSIGKLLDILEKVYHGAYLAKPVQFSELVPRFFYQEHKGTSFWLQKLLDYRHFPLPCIQKPTSFHTLTAVKEIRVEPVKLSAILSRAQVTVQCVAQAAWSKLISSITGACEVMFGHIVSGRSLAGASDVIGPVLNTIPCRVQLRGRTNIDLLRKIHEDNVDALPWQQASLRAIQRQLGLESLWDNIFSFQSVDRISEQHELWEFRQMDNAEIHTQYALSVEFNQTRDGFLVRCAARPDFSQSSSLDEMLKQLQEIMENILDSWDALALEDSMAIVTVGTPDTTSLHVTEDNVYGTRTVSVESEDNKVHVILRDLVSSLARLPAEIIDKNTPLVSLGIDSITAIQISNKARHAGIGISTTQIIGCRNFGDLVKRAQSRPVKATKSATPESLPQLSPREINGIISRFGTSSPLERILPTSPGQKFFIAGWQGMQARKYQHVFMFLLPPDVDKARLKVAWILLLQRHPLLRSTFANEPRSSEPRIIVFKNEVAPSTWSEEVSADDIFYQATAARVRNLAENPPSSRLPQARAILRHSEKKSTLLLHLHHFQYDAWSLSLLCRDLDVFYESQSVASVNDLTKYLSRTALTPEKRVIQDQYWNRVIPRRFKPTLFPKLNPASSSRNSRSICVVKTAIEGVALCEERASDLQISLHAILVACWARLQGKYTGMDDICFGIWQNGRTGSMEVIDRLAVPCVNILPMFVQGACATVTTTATRVQEILTEQVGIIEHTEFWRSSPRGQTGGLLEPVNLPYESPATANFDFSSTMDHLPITDLIKDELSVDVIIIPDRDAICVAIDASTALLDDEQAARIVDEYSKLVKQTLSLV
ncbi:hypothetical protein NP233_g9148 [Leucocoprinus birnbaumii]|uniref:Carrier domain-containing protein n=1 Tax=Leucocoprinus birnbaumii TaxID=56174 RepID=A0AAD5VPF7_9AGAR|nr:hypothetical protein NP233_g9148 [Leucocoprinus birnbaumii]